MPARPLMTPARSLGSRKPPAAQTHAFLSGPGGGPLKDLGTLPGGTDSRGFGVNDSGQVAGSRTSPAARAATSVPVGPRRRAAPGPRRPRPGGGPAGPSVNASGESVGSSITADGAIHAFLYSDGLMVDLNNLIAPGSGFTLVVAFGISDNGYITGYGETADGPLVPSC